MARRFCIDAANAVTKLTEDPPFGGLWCDQPALFLPARFAAALQVSRPSALSMPGEPANDRHEGIEIHWLRHVQVEPRIDRLFDIGL